MAQTPNTTAALAGFGLLISDVRVRGFRALQEVSIALGPGATILVGENNSGKTSFLEALATALGHRRARLEDLQRSPGKTSKAFTVDIRVAPKGKEFPKGATQVFGDAVQDVATDHPYVTIRARGELDEVHADVRLTRWYLKGWDGNPPVLQQPRPTDRALDLLSFEFLDARRDVLEQLRNRASLLGRALSAGTIATDVREGAETKLREVAEVLRTGLTSLSTLRTHLKGLRAALPGSVKNVEVDPIPQDLEDLVRAVDIRVEDPSGSFSASSLGMGTRALAALLVFRTFIDVGRAAAAEAGNSASLAAFEEPEAHLHPQAQRAVVRVIRDVPGQVIVSTHSGEVAGQLDVPEIRVFRRSASGIAVRECVTGPDPKSEDGIRRRRLLLADNAAAVFARVVVVVEGQTEHSMLPAMAEAWWRADGGPHAKGVEFVSSDGAGSSKHLIPTLDAWSVPWWVVVDGDAGGLNSLQAISNELGREIAQTAPEVVVLPPRIEEYLLSLAGYREVVFAVGDGWADQSITEWRQELHGQNARGGGLRDYQSAGWEDRVALDWLRAHKGTAGGPLGRAIASVIEADGRPRLPLRIRSLFESIDANLKTTT
jgi:putative ATP-dependent endonuclease of the OLD family